MKTNTKYILGIVTVAFFILGFLIADAMLFNGVKPRNITENGFQANYFAGAAEEKKAAVVLIGGGE